MLVKYLQADLHDFPGRKRLLKLTQMNSVDAITAPAISSIPWQNTIQQGLVW